MTKTILFFSGSLRRGSLNCKLADNAYAKCQKHKDVNAIHFALKDYQMPLYDGDDEERSGLPANAIKLKELFYEADGIFIASPEYNSSFTGVLKNTIDWLSRSHEANEPMLKAFNNKVVAISSASQGVLGGIRGLVPLRMMLSNINMHVIPQQVAIAKAHEVIDQAGNINDPVLDKMLESQIGALVKMVKCVQS